MKTIRHIRPLLIGSGCIIFYYFYYGFAIDIYSEHFVTALMVFFSSLGWSGMVIYSQEKQPHLLVLYSFVAIAGPVLMFFFFPGYNRLWHSIAFGLFFIAFVGLRFFTLAHVRYERKKIEEHQTTNYT